MWQDVQRIGNIEGTGKIHRFYWIYRYMKESKMVKNLSASKCNKTFRKSGLLKREERVLTCNKLLSCSQCATEFARAYILKTHKPIRTDEKPFSYKRCDYKQPTALMTHARIHTNKKPFSCSQCDYKWSTSGSLRRIWESNVMIGKTAVKSLITNAIIQLQRIHTKEFTPMSTQELKATRAGLQIRILKKLKNKKTHNSRKKLNNSAEKLKDLTKFTERRKKLRYFCCKNTLPEIHSIFILKKLSCLP